MTTQPEPREFDERWVELSGYTFFDLEKVELRAEHAGTKGFIRCRYCGMGHYDLTRLGRYISVPLGHPVDQPAPIHNRLKAIVLCLDYNACRLRQAFA